MTRNQRAEALEAVNLLTLPCQNVCNIAFKLVRNIMYGALNPEHNQLIVTPQVVTGLATLQSAVSDLSRAYIAHTDTVIGRGNASSLEQLNISNPLSGENALFGQRGPTPAPTTEAALEGKKRKRAPHDKNAPKRALTPFFLYLQSERTKIAAEMGAGKTAKEVQDEGGKRWREMSDEDKKVSRKFVLVPSLIHAHCVHQKWQDKYAVNFARYKQQMKSYKAGQGIPEITDAEAKALYEVSNKEGKPPSPPDLDPEHPDEEVDEDDEEEEAGGEEKSEASDEGSSEDSPEPIKAPPPKRAKTTKDVTEKKASAKHAPAKEIEPLVAERSSKSPEKKKKKGSRKKDAKIADDESESKKEVAAEPAISPIKAASPEKPKKAKGKKRKSEAA